MKFRNGFVANSSSSSFVVAFDRLPISIEDLQTMLFKNEKFYKNPYDKQEKWTTLKVAETVWDDLKKPLTYEEVIKEFKGLNYFYDDENFKDENGHIDYDKKYEAEEKEDEKNAKEFIEQNKGKFFFYFSYCDENGSYECSLEHGELFENLPNVRISRH